MRPEVTGTGVRRVRAADGRMGILDLSAGGDRVCAVRFWPDNDGPEPVFPWRQAEAKPKKRKGVVEEWLKYTSAAGEVRMFMDLTRVGGP